MNDYKVKILIIGTGFGGLCAAIRLLQEGEKNFIILERKNDVGGVWRDNQYPGCACDVQSHLFSFSFAPNPNWSHTFSRQPEIHAYLQDCVTKFGLKDYIRFGYEVKRMDWNEGEGEWRIQTNKGEHRANLVVGAFGALSEPSIPSLKGLEKFKGEVFHSATWPKKYKHKGKKVAVIGTGASAIQFIPEIQPDVESLHVFQRTPAWVLPREDSTISPFLKKVYSHIPMLQKLARIKIYFKRELLVVGFRNPEKMENAKSEAIKHLHSAIMDPLLREKLTPNYTIGCKRVLLSNNYYPALAQSNVSVHTTGIAEVNEDSLIDDDGNNIEVDTIIFGTGFQVKDLPYARSIFGRDGYSLSEEWGGSPKAYMGTTIKGFPNLFLIQGPNTGLGHSSVVFMIEAQVEHIMKTLAYMKKNKIDVIEPKEEAQQKFVDMSDENMKGTVWTQGCDSWYLDKSGRNSTLWPGYTFSFWRMATRLNPEDYYGYQVASPVDGKMSQVSHIQ